MMEGDPRPDGTVPPAGSLERLRREIDNLLETAWGQGEKALDAFGLRQQGDRSWTPAVDVLETPESVIVEVDLPGIDPALVEVTLVGNMLFVKGERQPRPTLAVETPSRMERARGRFARSIPLPVAVNPDQVVAEARFGVLMIRLTRQQSTAPRAIPVKVRETL